MYGISAQSGRNIGGIEHLAQSIQDILTTPLGSRVMRRDYGSRLFELVDAPFSAATRLAIIAATAQAIMTWEPRFEVQEVAVAAFEPGRVTLDLVGLYLPEGRKITIDGIEVT